MFLLEGKLTRMHTLVKALTIILTLTSVLSCVEKTLPPTVSTNAATEISTTSVVSGGFISDDGGAPIISKGICWNTVDIPTIDNNKTVEPGESLSFTSNLSVLTPGTTYFIRAYAVNSAGTSYGNSVSFKTLGYKPVLNAQNASNIQLSSATVNGTVNPNSLETTVTFEYGATPGYGSTILALQNPLSGDSDKNVSAELTELAPGNIYHFRIKAENTLGITYSSDMTFTTLGSVPSAIVESVTNLQYNTATVNLSVNPNYFSTTVILEFGTTNSYGNSISIPQSPLTGNNPVSLTADLSGLTQGTIYHLKVKATNELGITNSDDFTFTTLAPVSDIENNTYNIRTIGTQIWMIENLKTSKYNNGDNIGTTVPSTLDISNEVTPKYQWAYDADESNVAIYGRLYTGYVVSDSRKVCPAGWHVPSDAEWNTLTEFLTDNGYGYEDTGDDIAKSMAATSLWSSDPNPGNVGNDLASNNSSGFSALPAGYRSNDDNVDGIFVVATYICGWWSSTDLTNTLAWQRIMENQRNDVTRSYLGGKRNGISIRCLKDQTK